MKVLIIGYGRAGKRHGNVITEFGFESLTYDPFVFPHQNEELLADSIKSADFAVIATPPHLHLRQIRQCLEAGLPVLCEKPLCGLGQLEEARELLTHPNADKVMIAYNYRYHPGLIEAAMDGRKPFLMRCQQSRILPAWGLLLDHVSHDLDILRMFYPDFDIREAYHQKNNTLDVWTLFGDAVVQEEVNTYITERIARLYCLEGHIIDIDPDPAMFTAMWAAFLAGKYEPSLAQAIKIQELLEKCDDYQSTMDD